ncbi:MAG: sugar phosphate isomerase/epimerase [Ignavibacteriaceae bacterium]
MSRNQSRRNFIKLTGIGLAASSIKGLAYPISKNIFKMNVKKPEMLNLGLTSYTFRNFSLEEVIQMTKRLDLKRLSLKDMHLPLNSTKDQIQNAVNKINTAGLELYGAGVIYMTNQEEVNRAFEYAKEAGIEIIIGVPEIELLQAAEQKVREYNIKLAIHNHGPGDKRFPSPESVYEKIKNLDKRVGMCLDIGHTMRLGVNPSSAFEKYSDRIFDIHMKDVTKASPDGDTVEIGRGIIDIPEFLRTIKKLNYKGTVAFEYEKDKEDPLPGVAESVGYVRGILSVI